MLMSRLCTDTRTDGRKCESRAVFCRGRIRKNILSAEKIKCSQILATFELCILSEEFYISLEYYGPTQVDYYGPTQLDYYGPIQVGLHNIIEVAAAAHLQFCFEENPISQRFSSNICFFLSPQ